MIFLSNILSTEKWKTKGFDNFDRFDVLYEIEGVLVNETALRIGSGREEKLGSLDNPVLRDADNRVFIPGSSLKGVLRSWAERIARNMGYVVHDPWEIRDNSDFEIDPVEALFGSNRIASHVFVFDAYPVGGDARTMTRPGVAIDRFLGSTFSGPFYTEYVVPGTRWKFRMRVLNVNLEEENDGFEGDVAKILLSLLDLMNKASIQLGGRVSTGAGLVRLVEYTIYRYAFEGGRLVKKVVKEVSGGGGCE